MNQRDLANMITEPILCPDCGNEARVRFTPVMHRVCRGFQDGVGVSNMEEIYCPECGKVLDREDIGEQQAEFYDRVVSRK